MPGTGPYARYMDKPTRIAFAFDPDRLAGLPAETTDVHEAFLRELGLKPGWVAPGAEIVIDVAEHTLTTRYLASPEGTDGRTARPDSIPDGNGLGVLTLPHSQPYDGKELPELPDALRFALVDNAGRAGIHGATGVA